LRVRRNSRTAVMPRYYFILVAVLATGILIGYAVLPRHGPEQAMPVTGDTPSLPAVPYSPLRPGEPETFAALQQQLHQTREAQERLALQLETLQLRVEGLESGQEVAAMTADRADSRKSAPVAGTELRTSVQSLIDAGIPAEQAARIQGRLDEIDLQQLYLRDRATREGWLDKPRYHKERRRHLDAVTELRSDIGDDAYDRMLYTLGRANRVVIRDVMVNSSAEQYGLQSGDRIIEYDGQRVFSGNELNTLVTQGNAGTMTLVQVQRDGEIHDIYLPRGPLGIRMGSARILP
jgi:hypothetical protein